MCISAYSQPINIFYEWIKDKQKLRNQNSLPEKMKGLLSCSAESFVFQFAVQKCKD
jgi:hypothetical protein